MHKNRSTISKRENGNMLVRDNTGLQLCLRNVFEDLRFYDNTAFTGIGFNFFFGGRRSGGGGGGGRGRLLVLFFHAI